MKILFIGYWSVFDGLSEASIKPHLKILSSFPEIELILYVSIERTGSTKMCKWDIPKLVHLPYHSGESLLSKVKEMVSLTSFLIKLCQENDINKIIARSSSAGTFAYLVNKKTDIPFFVESFEPHADYMHEGGVWRKWDPRYILLKFYEKKIKYTASGLMPVSNAYKKILIKDPIISCPIKTIPCSVDLDKFRPDKIHGKSTRKIIGFSPNDFVGIYVGKFGDIYLDDLAFDLFGKFKASFADFKLIILTGQEKAIIDIKLANAGFGKNDYFIRLVQNNEVPSYLNAADFAFCFHRSHKYSMAYSPIKNGEYWACGLPVIIAKNIGDDSDIIEKHDMGILIDSIQDATVPLSHMESIIINNKRDKIRELATKYRNPEQTRSVYSKLIIADKH